MSDVDKRERDTQNRVISLFRDELGYRYLGDWTDRDGNSNIEEGMLNSYLARNGYTREQISSALYKSCAPRRTNTAAISTATTRPFTV